MWSHASFVCLRFKEFNPFLYPFKNPVDALLNDFCHCVYVRTRVCCLQAHSLGDRVSGDTVTVSSVTASVPN